MLLSVFPTPDSVLGQHLFLVQSCDGHLAEPEVQRCVSMSSFRLLPALQKWQVLLRGRRSFDTDFKPKVIKAMETTSRMVFLLIQLLVLGKECANTI